MNCHRCIVRLIAFLAGCLAIPQAIGQSETPGGTTSVFVEIERFELDESVYGIPTGEEWNSGANRGAIGIAWSNLRDPSGGPVYRASGKIYGGAVDAAYLVVDDLGNLDIAGTEARYLGFQAEGLGGYRLGGRVGFELVSGIGVNVWQRNIEDGETLSGDAYIGHNELYAVLDAKLGVGLFTKFENFGFALRGGPKLPIVAWERVYLYDGVDLMPKPAMSWFGQAEFTFGVRGKDNVTVSFYYDSYKFKMSDAERLTDGGMPVLDAFGNPVSLAYPDTDMKNYGVRIAVGF